MNVVFKLESGRTQVFLWRCTEEENKHGSGEVQEAGVQEAAAKTVNYAYMH